MKEQQNLEWKESWRDDYLRWICGFANAEGGALVVGRNDRGQAVGIKAAARLLAEIPNKVRDVLGIMVAVNLLLDKGKELIEIRVDPYPSPVSYKGEYHYRSGSTKQELKGAALSHFLLRKQGLHWDAMALPGLKVEMLDTGALRLFREQALRSQRLPEAALRESDTSLLERLHLLADGACKRATALLFDPQPSRWFAGSYVKIGYFETNVDLRYQDEVDGLVSEPFNPDIANTFFRSGQIESWGRGIERMVQTCIEAGLAAPVLKVEANGVWVIFIFASARVETSVKTSVKTSAKTSVKTSVALLELLGKNPEMTLAEVAGAIGLSVRAVEMASAKLVKTGQLRYIGPQRGGHWEVTEKSS
jgi:predicted HTH transcriptional regulator